MRDLMARYESVRDYVVPGATGLTLDIETVRAEDGEEFKLFHFRLPSVERHREFWRDEMISLVSHEIKNPLSAMKNSVDILLSGTPGDLTEGQRRFLGTSGRSIERLTHLVDGFLDVSRIRSGVFAVERARIDVREFLADITGSFTTLFNVRHVDVTWKVDDSAAEAHVDPARLEQVMINLLSNALKHTPEGGRIRITAEPAGVEAVGDEMRLLPWSELGVPRFLVIRVEDNGLGMSTETLGTVFERHHDIAGETRGRGAHLGLCISRALMEAQGGSLGVESTIGIGTTVTLYVPQNAGTACVLRRMSQARRLLERYQRSRRSAAVYALGKLTDDDWEDIAATWHAHPIVNPETDAAGAFHLWTIDGALAFAVVADRDAADRIEGVFSDRLVERDDGAYVFSSYAAGVCFTPGDATGFARVCNVAVQRMALARDAMARAAGERADTDMDCVLNEWKIKP
jgi:signal transduction histidine kinase